MRERLRVLQPRLAYSDGPKEYRQAYPSAFAGPLTIGFVFIGHSLNHSRGGICFNVLMKPGETVLTRNAPARRGPLPTQPYRSVRQD